MHLMKGLVLYKNIDNKIIYLFVIIINEILKKEFYFKS